LGRREFNSTLHQSCHGFATRIHGFSTKTKALAREIPPATQASHYLTSPGLAWDAMLKMTRIRLELISEIGMQLYTEKGLRGGISCIAHRHGKANNKYISNYDQKLINSFLMYLDANNLYGWAMSQPLPIGDFKWFKYDFLGKKFEQGLDEKALEKLGIKLKAKEKDY